MEERTAQWKAEAEQHKATSARLAEALERFEQVINNITEVFWLTRRVQERDGLHQPRLRTRLGPEVRGALSRAKVLGWQPCIPRTVTRCSGAPKPTRPPAATMSNTASSGRTGRCAGFATGRSRCATQQGEVYRIAGLAEDITERKRTREVLQTQAAILENMAEGVVVTDEQGVIVQMNPAGERIWGYERNEVLGQPASVFSALPEPEATAVMREVLAALQATGAWRGTFKNRRKDGAIIYCEAVISRLEVQGRVLMVAVEQDVTERVRAQEQLQMQARVLESMAEAVLMVDEKGTIVLTNPALDALLGYERGELAGKPMLVVSGHSPEAVPADSSKRAWNRVKTQGSAAGEYLARRKDGALDRGRDPEQRRDHRRPFLSGGRRAGHHRTQAGGTSLAAE